MKIDHIAIAVNDLEEAAKNYKEALGVNSVEFETVESEESNLQFFIWRMAELSLCNQQTIRVL
jgi:catechol 2,3-dioxygenase-like lactoylglutathione lyase family enzyme